MATLVRAGLTNAYATLGGRHVDVDSSGNIWVMCYSLANTRMEFWYSTDSGASFSENTSLRKTTATNAADQGHAFYIQHSVQGECVAVWVTCGSGSAPLWWYCRNFTSASTAWTALATNVVASGATVGSIVLTDTESDHKPTVGTTHKATNLIPATVQYSTTWGSPDSGSETGPASITTLYVPMDFQHTGDGRTAAVESPPLWMAYADASGVYVVDQTFNTVANAWRGSETPRTLEATGGATTDPIALVFDGSRAVVALVNDTSDTAIQWYERDSADTTTTSRTPTALSDGAVTNLAIRRDADNNTILYAVGTTSDDIKKLVYDRTGNSFGTWKRLQTTNAVANSLSVQAGYQSADGSAYYCWTHDNGSTYDVYVGLDGAVTNKGVPWAGLML